MRMTETHSVAPLATADRAPRKRAAYCVSNADHFLGAVALVNSLRLTGWHDQIVLVDCGLTKRQRDLLASEALLLPAPDSTPPHLLKVAGPLAHPAEVMVVLDVDMIVIRPLEPLLVEAAAAKRLLAVADVLSDRFDERWGELLGLGALRRQAYVNSGFLVAPFELGHRLFTEMERVQKRIDPESSMIAAGSPDDPFYFLDQDALNALLASSAFRREDVRVLDQSLLPLPPFEGLRIVDEQLLRLASVGGTEPFALHHYQRKPWLHSLGSNIYSELLPRLWLSPDLPLRLERADIPLRFRPGPAGAVGARFAASLAVAERFRRRLGARRRLRASWAKRPGAREISR